MLRGVLAHSADMRLHNVVAVEVGHLAVRFDPDLILCMGRDVVEGRNVQLKLARLLRKLPQACSDAEQLVASDGGGELCDAFADVVDPLALETEYVPIIGAVDEMGDIASHVGGEFLE